MLTLAVSLFDGRLVHLRVVKWSTNTRSAAPIAFARSAATTLESTPPEGVAPCRLPPSHGSAISFSTKESILLALTPSMKLLAVLYLPYDLPLGTALRSNPSPCLPACNQAVFCMRRNLEAFWNTRFDIVYWLIHAVSSLSPTNSLLCNLLLYRCVTRSWSCSRSYRQARVPSAVRRKQMPSIPESYRTRLYR